MDEAQTQAEPEIAAPAAETNQNETVAQATPPPEDKEWVKGLRRDRESAIRKSKALEEELRIQKEVMQRLMATQPPAQAPAPEEDILGDIEKEEYVPGPKVAKGIRKLEAKYDKQFQELERKYQAKAQASEFQSLQKDYPDIDSIVTSETLEILKERNPRLYNSIAKGADPIDRAIQAYEYIKTNGLAEEVPGQKRMTEVDKKLDQKKNASAPAAESRPIVQAFQTMTKAQNEALYKEMMGAAARVGGAY